MRALTVTLVLPLHDPLPLRGPRNAPPERIDDAPKPILGLIQLLQKHIMPPAKVLVRLPDLEHDALVRRARRARGPSR